MVFAPTAAALPAIGLALFAVLHLVALAVFGDRGAWGTVNDATYLPLTAAATLFAVRAGRHPAVAPGARRAWLRVAVGLGCWCAGSAIWFWLEHVRGVSPYPSVADVGFLLVYPAMLWGLLSFPSLGRRRPVTLGLDILTVVAGTWMAFWYFSLGPALQSPGPGLSTSVLSTAYPIGDTVLLLGVVTAWLRGPTADTRRVLALLGAGLLLMTGANLALSVTAMQGAALPGGIADGLWAGFAFLAAFAAHRQVSAAAAAPAPAAPAARRHRRMTVLPAAAVVVGIGVLWAAAAGEPFYPLGGLMVGLTVLVASVLVRQLVALLGAVRARESVAARERSLEAVVQDRTAELTATEAHFRGLIEHSSDVTTFVDRDLVVRWQSDSARRVLQWDPEALLGRSALEILPGGHRHPLCAALRRATAERGVPVPVSIEVPGPRGTIRHTESTVTRLAADAPRQGWVINTRDVTHQRELQGELTHQAFHDPLTGLANRSLLNDRLEHALSRVSRTAMPLAILAVDLDDFKAVNDSLGHAAGDELLREVARRLEASVRDGDTVARLGGDEFAVLLEPAGAEFSHRVAERILAALRVPAVIEDAELVVDASIGIAHTETDPATAVELLRNADLALYRAKADGKHGVCTYEIELHDQATRRLELHSGLRHALELDQLSLQYQPVFHLGTGRLIGAEALLRWTHPRLGSVSPAEFVPVAEETGLIVPLGAWVLERACAEAAAWPTQTAVNVNLSAIQLARPEIADEVRATLARTGLAPGRLTLEVTESALVDDVEATADRLEALKALGVFIAIDDFGTGYSSLSALSRFPADVLKIDRSFVSAMCESPRHRDVVTTVVRLGQALGMTTVAEGIETPDQQAALQALGCEVGQGYLFARPLDATTLRERLAGDPAPAPAAPA